MLGVALSLAVVATACSVGEGGATAASSSVLPSDIVRCSEIYVDGEPVTREEFGVACTTNTDDLISTRPIRITCDDGRELWWNDIAWGFVDAPMKRWSGDATTKVPWEALDQCQGAPGSPTPTSEG